MCVWVGGGRWGERTAQNPQNMSVALARLGSTSGEDISRGLKKCVLQRRRLAFDRYNEPLHPSRRSAENAPYESKLSEDEIPVTKAVMS